VIRDELDRRVLSLLEELTGVSRQAPTGAKRAAPAGP
jgi:hypothetical protein